MRCCSIDGFTDVDRQGIAWKNREMDSDCRWLAFILLVQATDGLSFSIPQPYSGYLKTVLQCFGSAVLIKLACDFAADLGETGLAEKVAFCGRCLLLLLLMPLFREFVALAEEMLQ